MIEQQNLDPNQQRLALQKRQLIRELKSSGRLKPATILNLNPFPLFAECGRIFQHRIASATEEHPERRFVITEPAFTYIFKDATDPGAGSMVRKNYDVKEIMPIALAFELYQTKSDSSREDTGGVVVFEGTIPDPRKKGARVQMPYLEVGEDMVPFLSMREGSLDEAIEQAMEQQKRKCMAMIQRGQEYADDPSQVSNIQNPHRIWARWAKDHDWIPELPTWVLQQTGANNFCPRCRDPFKPGAIMHTCGHAFNVLEAYKQGYIEFGNMQMDRMNAEEWKHARALNVERKKNRGE